ncbi:alanine racemase [Tractidigestivibacter scatoligenes]|uniref:Alanine racemase n=1 Tax=Tractidigestivibacter scatoligenes TaxID=1299998 RepID=A0A100YU25_TRASO|nr:hypothetical protein [Tractidigestivibacter scatoligenes]KUH57693.1 alanine racemase [Tractidigestivibacter scatoligenes]
MADFLGGNEWYWRLARTVVQGVLGVVVANLDMLVGATALPTEWRALVVALVMAELGKRVDEDAPEIERGDAR